MTIALSPQSHSKKWIHYFSIWLNIHHNYEGKSEINGTIKYHLAMNRHKIKYWLTDLGPLKYFSLTSIQFVACILAECNNLPEQWHFLSLCTHFSNACLQSSFEMWSRLFLVIFFCIQIVKLDIVLFSNIICFSVHQILQWI